MRFRFDVKIHGATVMNFRAALRDAALSSAAVRCDALSLIHKFWWL
jgi:hypothetical protein